MDLLNTAFNGGLRLFLGAFSWASPVWRLSIIAVVVSIGMLAVIRWKSDQGKISATKRKVHACLLELWLYSDEPLITWRTQKSLLRENLRYMGLVLRPTLWLALPVALLLVHLEPFFAREPLPAGRDTLITAHFRGDFDVPTPQLVLPAEFELSASPVRVVDKDEIVWRVRPLRNASGRIQLRLAGSTVEAPIEAGGTLRFIPGRRVGSFLAALRHPDGPRIPPGPLEWIEVAYPEAYIRVFAMQIPWLVWFFIVSMAAALLLRRRLHVTF